VVLLILESLGSTELVFILVMALVFFGPRKLPQMSRSMGKHLAEFRRASEDFKRTWDREVNLEEINAQPAAPSVTPQIDNSIWDEGSEPAAAPTIQAISPDQVIPRQSGEPAEVTSLTATDATALDPGSLDQTEPSRKRDWL
jgi:Tat protein translocase TatB subunit